MHHDDILQLDRHVPSTRRAASDQHHSPLLIVLTLLATLGVLLYASFLLNPNNRGDLVPWLVVVLAEGVLVVHTLLAMWTVLSGTKDPRTYAYWAARDSLLVRRGQEPASRWELSLRGRRPGVEVFVTVYGEPVETVRRTATAALAIHGEHRTWILDDGRSDEIRDLAEELGCLYLRRLSNTGAKAGNINHALSIAKGDFFCIFDADFVPHPEFIEHTLPFFTDDTVAFVQTPQTYGNLSNLISRGAGYMQTMFYRFVQPGRNHFNAAFCVGTNVMFRRSAVHEIGGICVDSKSEDVWTSLRLHERGWRSIYLAKSLAVGDAPETVEAYTKQQLRWATGGFEIWFRANPFSPRRRLTPDQRIMYGITSTHYLTGIVPGALLFVPPMEIFFDLRPVNLTVGVGQWLLMYAGFYLLQVALAFFSVGSFRWEVLMLAAVSYPIYLKALVNALVGREQQWHVTGSTTRTASPFNFMVPQVLTFVFLALTGAVGVWQNLVTGRFTLGTAWCVTNALVLGAFIVVALGESRRNRRAVRSARRSPPPTRTVDPPVPVAVPRPRHRPDRVARQVLDGGRA
ncbi:glycosyltransferase [Nocardioides houyundeii]|uniref:glycosyltransferase n=1 Tax=Nocardioides houyundeii TaxID=2045452 RepID=UPI000C77E03E|nr:glycosyltransferase [Nocardioides houyundeii]